MIDDAWVGVIVLDGVQLAGWLLSCRADVPDGAIAVGVPAVL